MSEKITPKDRGLLTIVLCFFIGFSLGLSHQTEGFEDENIFLTTGIVNPVEIEINNKEYYKETPEMKDVLNEIEIVRNIKNEIRYWNYNIPGEKTVEKIAHTIYLTSIKYDVDPYLMTAIAIVESNLRIKTPNSRAGAVGMFQIMPATARYLDINPHVFEENVKGAVIFISDLKKQYNNNIEYVLGHYNGGSNPSYKIAAYDETRNYVWNVMYTYNALLNK